MLFSATMGPDVSSLVREFTHDAAVHDVVGDEAPNDVDHYFWRVPRDRRPEITADIIEAVRARASSSPAPSTAPTAWLANSASAASRPCPYTVTAPRPSASARCAA